MSDILSAISILLAIILFFYDKTTSSIKNVLEKPLPPKKQTVEFEKVKNEIFISTGISLIYSLIYLIFFWLLLPTSFKIVMNTKFSIWNFDLSSTIYIIINFTILVFFIISMKNSIKLIQRYNHSIKITSE